MKSKDREMVTVTVSKFNTRKTPGASNANRPSKDVKVQVFAKTAYQIADRSMYGNNPAAVARRRKEAELRVKAWRQLTPQQQLQFLDDNGLRAERQRARILRRIEAAKNAPVQKETNQTPKPVHQKLSKQERNKLKHNRR